MQIALKSCQLPLRMSLRINFFHLSTYLAAWGLRRSIQDLCCGMPAQQLWCTGAPQHVEPQFSDKGSNPRPLHYKADSYPLDHPIFFLNLALRPVEKKIIVLIKSQICYLLISIEPNSFCLGTLPLALSKLAVEMSREKKKENVTEKNAGY